jgi:hypothetical protein
MNGLIFGFQRFVWCPKWTPASSKSFNAIPVKLPPKEFPVASSQLPVWELETGNWKLITAY